MHKNKNKDKVRKFFKYNEDRRYIFLVSQSPNRSDRVLLWHIGRLVWVRYGYWAQVKTSVAEVTLDAVKAQYPQAFDPATNALIKIE